MISRSVIDRTLHVIAEADLVQKIADDAHRNRKGRPTNKDMIRLFLVGMFLAVQDNRAATIQSVYETLTQQLTIDDQIRLGVRNPQAGPDEKAQITLAALQNVAKLFDRRLEYGEITAPDLDDEERARRREVVASLADAVCAVFTAGFDSTTYAIDATNVWSWVRSTRTGGADQPDTEADPDTDEEGTASGTRPKKKTDAGWGKKTAKNGKEEAFFGYHEHTMVLVPHGKNDEQVPPPLIARYTLSHPSADLAAVTLDLIDRAVNVTRVIVDRHYSYKKSETWRDELASRGIDQLLDLRADEQGWYDLDGVRFAASVPHCPAAPDVLGTIEIPGPDAAPEEMNRFRKRIELRRRYAAKLNQVIDPVSGKAQWVCPARYGTVGCPLVEGTVEAAGELMTQDGTSIPIIQNPPDPTDPTCPPICRQPTVVIEPGPLRKHIQPLYYGSDEWIREYAKRTYVEGSYGNRKNSETENYRRGYHRAGGIGRSMIYSIAAVVSYNMRMLRNWHERTGLGEPDNPLLAPDDQIYGYRPITAEEVQRELRAA
jgi:hypothetical protein